MRKGGAAQGEAVPPGSVALPGEALEADSGSEVLAVVNRLRGDADGT